MQIVELMNRRIYQCPSGRPATLITSIFISSLPPSLSLFVTSISPPHWPVIILWTLLMYLLLSRVPSCWMVSSSQRKDHKRNLNRQVYHSQALEEVHSTPQGATRGGQARMQAEWQNPGHMHFLGSIGRLLWCS